MKRFAAAFGALAFFAAVGSASANSVTFDLTFEFSGGQQPANTLTATFDDGGGTGTVTLTMSVSGPSATEFVDEWLFNFSGDSSDLSIVLTSDTLSATATDPVVTNVPNCCQADGDGLYDIRFVFDNSPPADRFGTGDTIVYTITLAGITASDFNVESAPAGGKGPFETAAHVQGIGDGAEGSGWVTIPEPGPALLFGIGSLLAGAAIRRRS